MAKAKDKAVRGLGFGICCLGIEEAGYDARKKDVYVNERMHIV